MHLYQEDPFCAQLWYQKHLHAPVYAGRTSRTPLTEATCQVPGAVTLDPVVEKPDADLSSSVVWFDAYVTNVDRTPRNTNILVWHRRLWLIDHGATLYVHHTWHNFRERSRDPFPLIKDHVLLPGASALREVVSKIAGSLKSVVIGRIVDQRG